ncbi:hypothetical protein D3C71_2052020 [compost metagenome]
MAIIVVIEIMAVVLVVKVVMAVATVAAMAVMALLAAVAVMAAVESKTGHWTTKCKIQAMRDQAIFVIRPFNIWASFRGSEQYTSTSH